MGKAKTRSKTKDRPREQETSFGPYSTAMANLKKADKLRETRDEQTRLLRARQPLDALSTAARASRYATHEQVYWTEKPDGTPLPRPISCTESDGFLKSIEPEGRYRMPERKYRTVGEVAVMLQMSRNAVHDAIDRGELHAFAPGKVKRILRAELVRYLQERGYSPDHLAEVMAGWEDSLPAPEAIQATHAIGCA
jgi:excisionase family DNA binding protein